MTTTTPMEKYFELSDKTHFSDEALGNYDPSNEGIRDANYKLDLEIARIKRSLLITHFNSTSRYEKV